MPGSGTLDNTALEDIDMDCRDSKLRLHGGGATEHSKKRKKKFTGCLSIVNIRSLNLEYKNQTH